MDTNSILRNFLDKTVGLVNLEVLKECKSTEMMNGSIYLNLCSDVTIILYWNVFKIRHSTFIKVLEVDIFNEVLKIKLNYNTEATLSFKDVNDNNDFFNIMLLQDTPFKFEDIEIIRNIISVLIDRFYSKFWPTDKLALL